MCTAPEAVRCDIYARAADKNEAASQLAWKEGKTEEKLIISVSDFPEFCNTRLHAKSPSLETSLICLLGWKLVQVRLEPVAVETVVLHEPEFPQLLWVPKGLMHPLLFLIVLLLLLNLC